MRHGSWDSTLVLAALALVCACPGDDDADTGASELTDATVGGDTVPTGGSEPTSEPGDTDDTGEPAECADAVLDPGLAPLRRMTHTQYNNTVRDLFPGAAIPPQTILVDPKVNGFENNSEVQTPSALLVEQYQKAALAVTAAAMATPTFLPCPADGGPDPAGCGHTFLRDLAARAFRRPLAPDEESAYLDFFDQQMAEHNFNVGLQLAMQAILQAPPFIYFPEFGGDALADQPALVQLTGHELAARLSYFLWDTTPDELLLSAAAGGDLDTIDGIEAEVLRMLADPRARSSLVNFHRQWFDLDKIAEVNPDPATHPDFTPALRTAMRQEIDQFVESTIFDGAGTFAALLTSPATTVDTTLADLYNVAAPPPNTWADATLPADQRSGILTRAGFLARTAHAVHPSPVRRGVFVLSRLLCVPPAPPPPDVNTAPPDEQDPDQPKTNRERYAKHTAQDSCAACHKAIDGVGFGFENYDALGKWRTMDNGHPVDASGELVSTDVDGPFTGALELSQTLAASEQAHGCVVSQVYRYALGRGTGVSDLCGLDDLRGQFAAASGDIRALLLAVVTSDAFRFRRGTTP
jgi:hypothetical protein